MHLPVGLQNRYEPVTFGQAAVIHRSDTKTMYRQILTGCSSNDTNLLITGLKYKLQFLSKSQNFNSPAYKTSAIKE